MDVARARRSGSGGDGSRHADPGRRAPGRGLPARGVGAARGPHRVGRRPRVRSDSRRFSDGDARRDRHDARGIPGPVQPADPGVAAALARIDRRVYVSLGNIQDIQPWHGWLFELDLDAWRAGGEAITASLVTTPEADCGIPGTSGARERQCGGGIWAPAGPLVSGGELFVPTGNGQLDVPRGDHANTL